MLGPGNGDPDDLSNLRPVDEPIQEGLIEELQVLELRTDPDELLRVVLGEVEQGHRALHELPAAVEAVLAAAKEEEDVICKRALVESARPDEPADDLEKLLRRDAAIEADLEPEGDPARVLAEEALDVFLLHGGGRFGRVLRVPALLVTHGAASSMKDRRTTGARTHPGGDRGPTTPRLKQRNSRKESSSESSLRGSWQGEQEFIDKREFVKGNSKNKIRFSSCRSAHRARLT